ncbi:MAG: porphobilinogen synthase [Gemmatimonadaceae bacterium]|nr:porphobilinogen synthase [Gemmatimonadaceae bacterium]
MNALGPVFPVARPRRLRRSEALRSMLRETVLSPRDFVSPVFVTDGGAVEQPIASMPGVSRIPVDHAVAEGESLLELGIAAILMFGVPSKEKKDPGGRESYADGGAVQRAVRALKAALPELVVITDVCLCEYTSHGHCGLVEEGSGRILNDPTLDILRRVAVSHAEAGADVVAPSGMMDGAVGAIRAALDEVGAEETAILSYAVKYASAFYGPFREAAGGAPAFGDRRTHQIDPGNARVAIRETALDLAEGADMLMVKPALAYLDVVSAVRRAHPEVPLFAYNVSGEYAMVKAAAAAGWLDERAVANEVLMSMKRAGADSIISYHAKDVARWLSR